jgi:aconitate hydratase
MSDTHNRFNTLREFDLGDGTRGRFHSLPALADALGQPVARLPVSLRIVLESVLRNCDGRKVTEQNVRDLAAWQPAAPRTAEIPFVVARIVLQDFTGVPLLVDLAAMRSAVARLGRDPRLVEPLVPVDLVVDHSVQVDVAGVADAFARNLDIEFQRNRERYQFLKWGMQAFNTFKVVPPGIGIVHQVNLEYLAQGVLSVNPEPETQHPKLFFPDTLVGTDSHTTMINGLGIVGWGVGGIEAEAGMLGQPVYFLTPDVVGVHLAGALREGVTATDLVLTLTQMLRKARVVGKFVEFFGPGAQSLSVVDRATIANMAPEYGATMGFFPVDEECVNYLRATGRSEALCRTCENYYRAQGLWGIPQPGQVDYSQVLDLDLGSVAASVAGPKRPQDRIELPNLRREFFAALQRPLTENGFGKTRREFGRQFKVETVARRKARVGTGSVLIAAITSCTNTSNPGVMIAAGLLAKKAVEKGLTVNPAVKASLAPGSRVVTDYLKRTGLQKYLNKLRFHLVGYGCTTCIGNSGPLDPALEEVVVKHDLITASVLSGNRNFEARVHPTIKANFLMSPPLVVAFALAGRVDIDLSCEPLGAAKDGALVFLADLWPTGAEIRDTMQAALKPEVFRKLYRDFAAQNPKWNEVPSSGGETYAWDPGSTYIQEPPFFLNFSMQPGAITEIRGARALGIFGDSVTTDHISPAGSIKKSSPAGQYLLAQGVAVEDFNSYGSRRGNDRVMTRGTFANVRIKNLLVPGSEGGVTRCWARSGCACEPGAVAPIYDAAMSCQQEGTPLIVIAGHEYGTGSSRDWAAKGTSLLGVKAVAAQSFERIHRSNLVGMGVLPLQFHEGASAQTLGLDGSETFDVLGLGPGLKPQQDLTLRVTRQTGEVRDVPVRCRIDTPIEIEYYQHGGILPFVLRQLMGRG